jgi:hypothetical protein
MIRGRCITRTDKARLNADSPRGAATAGSGTTDGRTLESTVHHARGSTEQTALRQDIEVKVRDLLGMADFRGPIDDIIAACGT